MTQISLQTLMPISGHNDLFKFPITGSKVIEPLLNANEITITPEVDEFYRLSLIKTKQAIEEQDPWNEIETFWINHKN